LKNQKGIFHSNGFSAIAALRKAYNDPRVAEIEGVGVDDGRVLIHLTAGWCFDHPSYDTHVKGVGTAVDLRDAMKSIRPDPSFKG